MFTKVVIAVFSCFAIICCNSELSIFQPRTTENKEAYFARQLRQNVKVRNSAFQSPCFTSYLPQLDVLNQQWALEDAYCKSNASSKYTASLTSLDKSKAVLNVTADYIVGNVQTCESLPDPTEGLTCLSELTSTQTQIMYDLSKNASDVIFEFNTMVTMIKDDMYVCGNATQRQYARQSNAIYQQLNYCLLYGPTNQATPPKVPPTPSETF